MHAGIPHKKNQFVVIHRYTILQETEKTCLIVNRPRLKHGTFLRKYEDTQFFCGHKTLTGVFVTQLSINAEIWVWRIVWVTINCRFMSNMFLNNISYRI